MKTLCLHPVMRDTALESKQELLHEESSRCAKAPRQLWLHASGRLKSLPISKRIKYRGYAPVSTLICRNADAPDPTWWLIPISEQLTINGIRPLPLAALEPGDLLAAGRHRWLVTSLWRPVAAPAPPNIAERECPVCGGPLKLAPVIRCPCGRYYHLENAEDRDNRKLLNCYLTAGGCGLCEREPSLEPMFLPEPHETLLDAYDEGSYS